MCVWYVCVHTIQYGCVTIDRFVWNTHYVTYINMDTCIHIHTSILTYILTYPSGCGVYIVWILTMYYMQYGYPWNTHTLGYCPISMHSVLPRRYTLGKSHMGYHTGESSRASSPGNTHLGILTWVPHLDTHREGVTRGGGIAGVEKTSSKIWLF
jgi:hypothetical protein